MLTSQQVEMAHAKIQNGEWTLAVASRSFGIAPQTMSKLLIKSNRPTTPVLIEDGKPWCFSVSIPGAIDLINRANLGETYSRILKETGMDLRMIRKMANKLGIAIKGRYRHAARFTPPGTEWERAYLAAMIDGEGSVCVPPKSCKSYGSVTVYNTNKALMDWMSGFGGLSYSRNPGNGVAVVSKKVMYSWSLRARLDIKACLESILPFMIVKRDKAIRLLDHNDRVYKNAHNIDLQQSSHSAK